MNQILIIIAIVGIGYLLYRSLIIKRQPTDNNERVQSEAGSQADTSADSQPSAQASAAHRESAEAKPLTAHNPPPSEPVQADQQAPNEQAAPAAAQTPASQAEPGSAAENKIGSEAVKEAHQAEARAAQQEHMETAAEATKSALEKHAGSGIGSDPAPAAPTEVEVQAAALGETDDPLARHRLYQQIIEQCYRARDDESARLALLHYAKAHIDEFDDISKPLKKQNGGKLPQVATFKHYAAVLTDSGQYDEAIAVCQQALAYGLKDGTKTGYQGRLERIEKLQAKHQG